MVTYSLIVRHHPRRSASHPAIPLSHYPATRLSPNSFHLNLFADLYLLNPVGSVFYRNVRGGGAVSPFKLLASKALTALFATLPENPPVSLIIATLPKSPSRKPFICHTSETPRGVRGVMVNQIPVQGICPERPSGVKDLSYTPRQRAGGGGQDICGKCCAKVHPISRYNPRRVGRLIALDIDGTLLDSRWQLPEANRAAIAEATRRGIEGALVTGRRYDCAMPVARKLDSPLTMIVNNGALIRSKEGRTHLRHLLPRNTALQVLELTRPWREGAAGIFDGPLENQLMLEGLDPDDSSRYAD